MNVRQREYGKKKTHAAGRVKFLTIFDVKTFTESAKSKTTTTTMIFVFNLHKTRGLLPNTAEFVVSVRSWSTLVEVGKEPYWPTW